MFKVYIYKIIITLTSPYRYNKITYRTDIPNINLRFRGNIRIPVHYTEFGKRTVSYQIAKYLTLYALLLKIAPFVSLKLIVYLIVYY